MFKCFSHSFFVNRYMINQASIWLLILARLEDRLIIYWMMLILYWYRLTSLFVLIWSIIFSNYLITNSFRLLSFVYKHFRVVILWVRLNLMSIWRNYLIRWKSIFFSMITILVEHIRLNALFFYNLFKFFIWVLGC
jgi:hypothetical protein